MASRITIASDHVDLHGDRMSKDALESMVAIVNGERKVRWGIDHQRDLPPFGRIANAILEEIEGHFYVTVEQIEYDTYEDVDWNNDLLKASFSTNQCPFNEPDFDIPAKFTVSIDPQNFTTPEDYEDFLNILRGADLNIATEEFARKALISDPEIAIRLTEAIFIYKLLKPIAKNIAKKASKEISNRIADDSGKLYSFIKESTIEMLSRVIPKNRPVNYIIKLPGIPEIELLARIKDPEILIKALKESRLKKLRREIDKIESNLNFEKIQFTLTGNGNSIFY